MIYVPWNKFCMIRVIWQVQDGSSTELWSSRIPMILVEEGPPNKAFLEKWYVHYE